MKPKFKELINIIVENTDPSMSRMEAWEAVAVVVPRIDLGKFQTHSAPGGTETQVSNEWRKNLKVGDLVMMRSGHSGCPHRNQLA